MSATQNWSRYLQNNGGPLPAGRSWADLLGQKTDTTADPNGETAYFDSGAFTPQARVADTAGTTTNAGLFSGDTSAWDATDMGDLGGAQWIEGRGWTPTGQGLSAGYKLGHTGATLPVAYNATQDVDRHEWSGKNSEPSWRRVNRWAGDFQRQGYDPQTAYNMALSRLKNDYEVSGADWRRSGFDLTNVQSSAGGAAYANGQKIGGGQAQGQGTAPAPGASPTQAGTNPVPAGASAAAAASSAAAQQGGNQVSGYTDQGGGVNTPPGGAPGPGGQGNMDTNLFLSNNKAARVAALMQALGLGSPSAQHSLVGQALGGFYGAALDPFLAAKGLAAGGQPGQMPLDNLQGMIGELAGLGNKVGGFGTLRNVAQQGINAFTRMPTEHLDEQDVIRQISDLSALANAGMPQILQQLYGNMLDDSVPVYMNSRRAALQSGDRTAAAQRWLPYIMQDPTYGFLTGRR